MSEAARARLRYRLGCGTSGPDLEAGLDWAAEHGFHFVDFNADVGANGLERWDDARVAAVRARCERNDLHLGIHTLSAVNVAEFSPFLREAVDAYLRANLELGQRLGAERVIVHAGLHQSSQLDLRRHAAREHLERAARLGEALGVDVLLENMNVGPAEAELHYLGQSIDELRELFEAIPSPRLKWGFSANHAHLRPEGVDGFLDAFGVERIGLVLLSDCRGTIEEHLLPGEGTLDFARLFGRLEGEGYGGPYMLTFGTREERLAGREYLLARAPGAS